MNAEPQLEELSAYLDHELTGSARQDLESHLAGCDTCRRRLEALKETVQAVRGLPLETPARSFTIPAQRRQSQHWEPAAWIGGLAAAAVLTVVVGLNLPHGGNPLPTSASLASKNETNQNPAAAGAPGAAFSDRSQGLPFAAYANQATVSDPAAPARLLTLSTDSASYRADRTLTLHLTIQGVTYTPTQTSTSAGVRVVLVRAGAGIELYPGETFQSGSTVTFAGSYNIGQLGLSEPVAGSYRLMATWRIPDGKGTTLEADVPIQITSG